MVPSEAADRVEATGTATATGVKNNQQQHTSAGTCGSGVGGCATGCAGGCASSTGGAGSEISNDGSAKNTPIRRQNTVSTDPRAPPSKQECCKLVQSLSREVAVYCGLSLGIGNCGDCNLLREELKTLSAKLFDRIMLCERRLMPLLLSQRSKEDERLELERLYRIFAGCLEMLQSEFVKSISLQGRFPLWDASTLLIQTGLVDCTVTLTKRFSSPMLDTPSATERRAAEKEEFVSLQRKVATLQEISYDTSQLMDVKPWDHQPDPDLTKIDVETSETVQDSRRLEDVISPRTRSCFRKHRKFIIAGVVVMCILLTAVLVLSLVLTLPHSKASNSSTN